MDGMTGDNLSRMNLNSCTGNTVVNAETLKVFYIVLLMEEIIHFEEMNTCCIT